MTNHQLDFEQRQQAERMAENGDQLDQCFELVWSRAEIERLNRKCGALAILLYGSKPAIYEQALTDISTFFNGNPLKHPTPGQAANAMVEIADKALNAAESGHEPKPNAVATHHCQSCQCPELEAAGFK